MKSIAVSLFCFFVCFSCRNDKTLEPTKKPPKLDCGSAVYSFSNDVLPIFQSNCSTSNCHSSITNAGGLTTETYEQIKGDISLHLSSMKHEVGFVAMPYFSDKLADSVINIVECWKNSGSLNN